MCVLVCLDVCLCACLNVCVSECVRAHLVSITQLMFTHSCMSQSCVFSGVSVCHAVLLHSTYGVSVITKTLARSGCGLRVTGSRPECDRVLVSWSTLQSPCL